MGGCCSADRQESKRSTPSPAAGQYRRLEHPTAGGDDADGGARVRVTGVVGSAELIRKKQQVALGQSPRFHARSVENGRPSLLEISAQSVQDTTAENDGGAVKVSRHGAVRRHIADPQRSIPLDTVGDVSTVAAATTATTAAAPEVTITPLPPPPGDRTSNGTSPLRNTGGETSVIIANGDITAGSGNAQRTAGSVEGQVSPVTVVSDGGTGMPVPAIRVLDASGSLADGQSSHGNDGSAHDDNGGHVALAGTDDGNTEVLFATSAVPSSDFTPPTRQRSATNDSQVSSSSGKLDQSPMATARNGVKSKAVAAPSHLANESESISFLSELGFGPGQIIERQMFDASSAGDIDLVLEITATALNVEVKEMKEVRVADMPAKSDLYIKCYLQHGLPDTSKHVKKRTKPVHAASTMAFNERLHFKMNATMDVLKVMLWEEQGRLGRNTMYGMASIQLTQLDDAAADSRRSTSAPSYRTQKQTFSGTYPLLSVRDETGHFGLRTAGSASTLASVKTGGRKKLIGKLR